MTIQKLIKELQKQQKKLGVKSRVVVDWSSFVYEGVDYAQVLNAGVENVYWGKLDGPKRNVVVLKGAP